MSPQSIGDRTAIRWRFTDPQGKWERASVWDMACLVAGHQEDGDRQVGDGAGVAGGDSKLKERQSSGRIREALALIDLLLYRECEAKANAAAISYLVNGQPAILESNRDDVVREALELIGRLERLASPGGGRTASKGAEAEAPVTK